MNFIQCGRGPWWHAARQAWPILCSLVGLPTASSIAVGSPAWYAWLEQATTFAFTSAQGSFTARKERRGQSGWYWKAYRKRDGTLRRAYLGKSADLTPERLTTIASELAQRATGSPPLESASVLGPAMAAVDEELPHLTGALLPEGTLTFCFTDIEGSTQLWEQHPQRSVQSRSTSITSMASSTCRAAPGRWRARDLNLL